MNASLADALRPAEAEEARAAVTAVDGIASQADLARRWGYTRQRVHQMIREPAFPKPAGYVNGQAVWFAAEADRWLEHRELFIAEAALHAGQASS
jgi:predicted DNA-binding transcriptional regulator AlpA